MNQEEFLRYKRQYDWVLKPFFDMLEQKREGMSDDEWSLAVIQLEACIINAPEQYLGHDLPEKDLIGRIIKEIFEDFLEEKLDPAY